MSKKIDESEGHIMSDLEGMESKRLEQAQKVAVEFEDRLVKVMLCGSRSCYVDKSEGLIIWDLKDIKSKWSEQAQKVALELEDRFVKVVLCGSKSSYVDKMEGHIIEMWLFISQNRDLSV